MLQPRIEAVEQRAQRQPPGELVADGEVGLAAPGPRPDRPEQRRLADAGLAFHPDHPAAARGERADHGIKLVDLAAPSGEVPGAVHGLRSRSRQ